MKTLQIFWLPVLYWLWTVRGDQGTELRLLMTKLSSSEYKFICVATGDVSSSALVLNTPLMERGEEEIPESPKSTYVNNVRKILPPISNNIYYNGDTSSWQLKNALDFPMEALIDERWEDLPEIKTDGKHFFENPVVIPRADSNTISFSVRIDKNAQIGLCEDNYFLDSRCYWIILKGLFENNPQSRIRKCERGIANDPLKIDEECSKARVVGASDVVTMFNWQTFTLKGIQRDSTYYLDLYKNGETQPFLSYTDDENIIRPKYFNVRHLNLWNHNESKFEIEKATWRIHDYQFSYTNSPDKVVNHVFDWHNQDLYILLYVSLCNDCSLNVRITDYKNVEEYGSFTVQPTSENTNIHGLFRWQKIYHRFTVEHNRKYKIHFKTQSQHNNPYWMIDKITLLQRVPDVKSQSVTIRTERIINFQNNRNISCQLLSPPKSVSFETALANETCDSNCIRKCDDVSETTQNLCKQTMTCTEGKCKCPLFYGGRFCEAFQLKMIVSGADDKHTQIKIEVLPVHQVSCIYEIEYTMKSKENWVLFKRFSSLNFEREIVLENLTPATMYEIRASIVVNKQKYTSEPVNAETYCYDPAFEILEGTSTKSTVDLKIEFKKNASVCDFQSYSLVCQYDNPDTRKRCYSLEGCTINEIPLFKNVTFLLQMGSITVKNKTYQTREGVPTEIRNLKLTNSTSSSISVSWIEPTQLRGLLKNYIVQYQNYQHRGCPFTNSEDLKKANTLQTNETNIRIENLSAYSSYRISVAAITGFQGEYYSLSFDTKATDISDEIIQEITYDVDSRVIRLKIKMNCTTIKGPVFIRYDGVGDPKVKLLNITTFTEKISPLEPFTAYTIVATPGRQNNYFNDINSKSISFTAAPEAPPAVTKLEAYSKDATGISLRWMAPNPPYGELELYNIIYKQRWSFGEKSSVTAPKPCELFEGLTCFEIKDHFYENSVYTIKVFAKNRDVVKLSLPGSIKVTPKIEASTIPQNLTTVWNRDLNQLIVNWEHPNLMNGPIRHFVIELKLKDNDEQEYSSTEELKEFKEIVRNYMKKYKTEITDLRQPATYDISVYAFNGVNGKCTSATNVIFPPLKPQFHSPAVNVSIINKNNSTVTIVLPNINVENKSRNCALYVVISDNTVTTQIKGNADSSEKILEQAQVLGKDSWVAAKLKVPLESYDFTIGDGTDNGAFRNKPIDTENRRYEIIIVLENEYRGASAYSRYSVGFTTDEVLSLPASLVGWIVAICIIVLLVSVVLCIAYRWKSKKRLKLDFKTIVLPGMRRTRPALDTGSCTIPLTVNTASNDSNPRNEAKMLKPKKSPPSSKVSSASSTPQMNVQKQHDNSASRRVNISEFKHYVQEAFKTDELQKQHEMFPRGQTKPITYGSLPQNKSKNRYANLVAYDATRVILSKLPNDPFSDYINANYVDGYQSKNAYIATQGPKPKTVNDFWRMMWQENCKYIIMLTNLEEKNKKKCEQYWPNINEYATYGEITVLQENTKVHADYVSRFFKVSHSDKGNRTVEQLHFTSWPDHGVPLYPKSLVPFLKRIVEMPLNPPIIVHCSAGVGRTGTIILCDICLRMAAKENALDVLHYLKEIREQRSNLVDNIDQYKLVHLVLVESLLTKPTSFPCNEDFEQTINKLIKDGTIKTQMDEIDANSWQDVAMRTKVQFKKMAENRLKNRFQNILPESAGRVFISRWPLRDEHSDYINAVTVDGFRAPDQFIVTQQPLPNTVADFWRLVQEQKATVIVSLNNILSDDDTTLEFWPSEDVKLTPVPYLKIKHIETVRTHFFDLITLRMTERSPDVDKQNIRTMIKLLQVNQWEPGNVLPSGEVDDLISLWRETYEGFNGHGPIIVTCHDGSTACGLFVALSFVIEKIKLEQECDVCLAVRTIRRNRQQFVRNQEQFKFLYKTAVSFVDSFEQYSNFQPTVNND